MTFPVLNFKVRSDIDDKPILFKWYPSEYLYKERQDMYCMAAEPYKRGNEIMLGGTSIRQNALIFDIENNKVGFARA